MEIRMGILTVEGEGEDDPLDSAELPIIELVLSERNLRTLLLNLDSEDNGVARMTQTGILLSVRAESDAVHYAERSAGLMDEETEAKLLAEELDSDEPLFLPPNFGSKMND